MTETRLRDTLSVFLLFVHVAIPLLLLCVFLLDGLTRPEFVDSMTIVVPMLSLLTGLAITHIVASRQKSSRRRAGRELSRLFVFVAFLLPILFAVLIAALIILKAYNIAIRSFPDFKIVLAALETIFGAYTGKVLVSLFDKEGAP